MLTGIEIVFLVIVHATVAGEIQYVNIITIFIRLSTHPFQSFQNTLPICLAVKNDFACHLVEDTALRWLQAVLAFKGLSHLDNISIGEAQILKVRSRNAMLIFRDTNTKKDKIGFIRPGAAVTSHPYRFGL